MCVCEGSTPHRVIHAVKYFDYWVTAGPSFPLFPGCTMYVLRTKKKNIKMSVSFVILCRGVVKLMMFKGEKKLTTTTAVTTRRCFFFFIISVRCFSRLSPGWRGYFFLLENPLARKGQEDPRTHTSSTYMGLYTEIGRIRVGIKQQRRQYLSAADCERTEAS